MGVIFMGRFSWEGFRTRQMRKWNDYLYRKLGEEGYLDDFIRRGKANVRYYRPKKRHRILVPYKNEAWTISKKP